MGLWEKNVSEAYNDSSRSPPPVTGRELATHGPHIAPIPGDDILRASFVYRWHEYPPAWRWYMCRRRCGRWEKKLPINYENRKTSQQINASLKYRNVDVVSTWFVAVEIWQNEKTRISTQSRSAIHLSPGNTLIGLSTRFLPRHISINIQKDEILLWI